MDSLTQMTLGAAVGEAVLGKKVGNKAALWGAVAGTIPDLDVIPGRFMDTVAQVDFHRGFSHSIIFCLIMAPLLGFFIDKFHGSEQAERHDWTKLAFWSLLTHPLLDCFTTWGTQLFWPLDHRVAFKTIFVIDPLYTLPLLVCLIWLLFKKKESSFRRKLNLIGLALSSAYLLITVVNKQIMNHTFEEILQARSIEYTRFSTQPTPLNNLLWAVTAETEEGFYVGYHSFFDSGDSTRFSYFKKNHQTLDEIAHDEGIERLTFLMDGYFTVERSGNRITINDLRFGLVNGWLGRARQVVFAYELDASQINEAADIEIRRKPASINLNLQMLEAFWGRIRGS